MYKDAVYLYSVLDKYDENLKQKKRKQDKKVIFIIMLNEKNCGHFLFYNKALLNREYAF